MKTVNIEPTHFDLFGEDIPSELKFFIKKMSIINSNGITLKGWGLVLQTMLGKRLMYITNNLGQKCVTLDTPISLEDNVDRCIDIYNLFYGEKYGQISHIKDDQSY